MILPSKNLGFVLVSFMLLLFIVSAATASDEPLAIENEFVAGKVIYVSPPGQSDINSFVTNVKVQILEGKLAGRIYEASVPNDPPYAMDVHNNDKVMIVIGHSQADKRGPVPGR